MSEMPHRPTTPTPVDENRFLTIVHPYPLQANMKLQEDREECSRWLARFIPPNALIAIYYKPRSPSMLIVEIQREVPQLENILGEHTWSEFLRNPGDQEKDRVSRLFFCTLGTGRAVQKEGWRRVDIDPAWLKDCRPNDELMEKTYPTTHYCKLLPEDKTRFELCRPLPIKWFPHAEPIASPPGFMLYHITTNQGSASSHSGCPPSPVLPHAPPPSRLSSPARRSPIAIEDTTELPLSGDRDLMATISLEDEDEDEDDDDDDDHKLFKDCTAPSIHAVSVSRSSGLACLLWYSAEPLSKAPEVELCLVHHIVCGGICRQYAAQLKEKQREKERREREQQREKARAQRVERGRGHGAGRGRGSPPGRNDTGSSPGAGKNEVSGADRMRAPRNHVVHNGVRKRPTHLTSGGGIRVASPAPKRAPDVQNSPAPAKDLPSGENKAVSLHTPSEGEHIHVQGPENQAEDDDAWSVAEYSDSEW
ncbi:hypothetical protein A0H81_10374 [Grifola frondosa]|uniref:Uncharacterized protein n=1 Tax=Grifola frondosa TaxID=5627 RepID=A0A1C7LZK1_GRIFR|nr:hypothetical protein A0H81_10374 [Grifola frondosa]